MPDKKISGLPEVTTVNDTDLLTTVRPGDAVGTKNKKINGLNAKKAFTEKLYANLDANGFGINSLLDPILAQDAVTKSYADSIIGVACPPESQIYHVRSGGSDSDTGLCRAEALLTTNAGITKAIAQTPATDNRFTIFNPDAHEENTFILQNEWINLDLRHTNFSAGTNVIYANTSTIINEAEIFGGSICIHKQGVGLGYLKAKKLRGFGTGTNILLDIDDGPLIAEIDYFDPKSGDFSIRIQENQTGYIYTNIISENIEIQTGGILYLTAFNASNTTFTGAGTLYLYAQNATGANFSGFTGTVYKLALKGGSGIIDPILSYTSHPTFPETNTEVPDIKWVKDYIDAHPVTNLTGVKDVLSVTSNGQTAFTLSQTPIDDATFTLILNHDVHLINGTDYTYTGTTLTWLDPAGVTLKGPTPGPVDELVAHYNYLASPSVVTKSIVSTFMYAISATGFGQYDLYPVMTGSGGSNIVFGFTIPENLVAITSIKIMVIPQTPTSGNITFDWRFGKDGQSKTAHTGQAAGVPVNLTAFTDKHTVIDITSYFSAAEAGDRCTCRIIESALGINHYLGVEIIYT